MAGLVLLGLFKGCLLPSPAHEKEYYIGQDPSWHNLNLLGRERNFTTFTYDLLAAIAKREEFGVHVTITPFVELIPQLEQGKLQGMLTALQPTPLNTDRFIFSEPYFLTGPVLVIRAAAPLKGWNERGKKIVGIGAESHSLLGLEQDPSIQIKIYNEMLKALSDLDEGRIDGAVFPLIPAYTYVTTFYKDKLKIATLPLTDEGVRLAALKNSEGERLIQRFNKGLEFIKQNGFYQKLLKQWGFVDPDEAVSITQE